MSRPTAPNAPHPILSRRRIAALTVTTVFMEQPPRKRCLLLMSPSSATGRNHSEAEGHQGLEEGSRDSGVSGVGADNASSDIPNDPAHTNATELRVPLDFNRNTGDWLKTQLRSFRQEKAVLEHVIEDARARAHHLLSMATKSEKELEKVHELIAQMKKELAKLSPDGTASSDEEEISHGARHEHHAPIHGRSQAPSPRSVSPSPQDDSPSTAQTPRAPTTFRLVPARFTPPASDIQDESRAPTPIARHDARSLSPLSLASGVSPPFPATSNALGLVLEADTEQASRPTPEHDNGDVQRRGIDDDRQIRDSSEDDQRRSPSPGDESVRSQDRESRDVEDSPLERKPTPFSPVSSSFVPVSYTPMRRVSGSREPQVVLGQKRRWEDTSSSDSEDEDEDVEMDIESRGGGRLAKRTRSGVSSRSGSGNGDSEHFEDGHGEGLGNDEEGESISCLSSQSSWIESQVARRGLPSGQKIEKRARPQAAAETRVASRVQPPHPQFARGGLLVGYSPIARPEEQNPNVPTPGVPFGRVLDRSQSVTRTPTPSRPHTRSQTRLRNQPQAVVKKRKIPIPREALRQLRARAQARIKPEAQPQPVTAQNERNNVNVDETRPGPHVPERSRPATRSRTRAQAATQPQAAAQVAAPEPWPVQRLRRTAPRPALPLPRSRKVATLNDNAQTGGSGLTAEEKEKIAGRNR
ncbi:hypothetical protein BDY19DRAFT_9736 [Irpex rosettiformis]|uniref:Uncharacterized protein n=1 Tax=Irpex rosettiformis TaxID=378272 RepID=A0ACB8UIX2_9APHY|nr:hypothetical protein BDY19DRAFT_9736 [Irpex rosettiformis]